MSKPVAKLGSETILDQLCYYSAHLSRDGYLEKSQELFAELVKRKNIMNLFEAAKFMNRAKPEESIPEEKILGRIDAAMAKKDWGDFRMAMDAFIEKKNPNNIIPLIDLVKKHSADEQAFPFALIALRISDKMILGEKDRTNNNYLAASVPEIFKNVPDFKETYQITYKGNTSDIPYSLVIFDDFLFHYSSIFNMTVGKDFLREEIVASMQKMMPEIADLKVRKYFVQKMAEHGSKEQSAAVLNDESLLPSGDAARTIKRGKQADPATPR